MFSSEPTYVAWVMGLDDPAGSLLEFKNYIVASTSTAASRPRSRSPRLNGHVQSVQTGDAHRVDIPNECRVCYDLPVRTVFFPVVVILSVARGAPSNLQTNGFLAIPVVHLAKT